MELYLIPWIAGMVALCFCIREKLGKPTIRAAILKDLSSIGFFFTAIACMYTVTREGDAGAFGWLLLLGSFFGVQGDVWLSFKYLYKAQAWLYTFVGIGMFAAGHIFYIAALLISFGKEVGGVTIGIPVAMGVLIGIATGMLEKKVKLEFGRFKYTVMAYAGLLSMTMFLSGAFAVSFHWQNPVLDVMFVAMVLFAVSDVILSRTYFSKRERTPALLLANYITYYGAQYVLAFSILLTVEM